MRARASRGVEITDLQQDMEIPLGTVEGLSEFALRRLCFGGQVSVAFVGAAEMRRLNRRWFGRRGLTDVIAFPLGAMGIPADDVWGEVVVCPARAVSQAGENDEDPGTELLRLVVHGLLHLCGRTDGTAAKRAEMLAEGEALLRDFAARRPMSPGRAGASRTRTRE